MDSSKKDVHILNMTYLIIGLHGKLLKNKIKLAFSQTQLKHLYHSDINYVTLCKVITI